MQRYLPELRALTRLAIPIAAAQAGSQLMSLVDTAVVGRLGALPLAAIGLGNSLFFVVSIVGMGVVMGVDPLASQAVGAGDAVRARIIFWQGIWLSAIVTLLLGVIASLLPLAIGRIGLDHEVVRQASFYLWIRLASLLPILVFIVARAYLQARHITRPMLTAMLAGNVFNFLADLLLVFGGGSLPWWCGVLRRIPPLGITGAAVATLLGSILQMWIICDAVNRVGLPGRPQHLHLFRRSVVAQAAKVGLPVGLQMGAEYGIFALVGVLAGRFGPEQLASHQVALTLASLSFTFAVGIGSAGSVRVGNAIGQRDALAVRHAGVTAVGLGVAVMLCSALLFILFPRALASIITTDASVIALAMPLLLVAAVFQLSDGIQAVGAGILRGAGDTRFPFIANVVGHWGVGLPIALFIGIHLGYGVAGLWWGLCAGLTAVAALLLLRFLRISRSDIIPLHER